MNVHKGEEGGDVKLVLKVKTGSMIVYLSTRGVSMILPDVQFGLAL